MTSRSQKSIQPKMKAPEKAKGGPPKKIEYGTPGGPDTPGAKGTYPMPKEKAKDK